MSDQIESLQSAGRVAVPADDSSDNNFMKDVIGSKSDTVGGDSIVALAKQAIAACDTIPVPSADSADDVYVQDVVGKKADTVAGDSLVALAKQLLAALAVADANIDLLVPAANANEQLFPKTDGLGTAGVSLAVTSDSQDEDTAAATTQDEWGEPDIYSPAEAGAINLTSFWLEGVTAAKVLQLQAFAVNPSLESAKNGGNDWNKTATVLTVADGSLFATGDLVLITSSAKDPEIQSVASVTDNAVTIARETHSVGINGLRWDHTSAGTTEKMTRIFRAGTNDAIDFKFVAAVAGYMTKFMLPRPKAVEATGSVVVRAANQTDATNATNVKVAIGYTK